MSLARWRRRRIDRSRKGCGIAQDKNTDKCRGNDSYAQGKKIFVDHASLDVALFERHVRVARLVNRVVGLSAHDAQWPPIDPGLQAAAASTVTSCMHRSLAT